MQRGESVISVAVAGVVMLAFVAVHARWQPAALREMAASAREFLRTAARRPGQIPELAGYERVVMYHLDRYNAALYRRSPAPLIFAPGMFIIYDEDNRAVFKLDTLEGSREHWTTLYDFAGHRGKTVRPKARPVYLQPLTGTDDPHVIVGQYSGGDHCCTTATIVELGEKVRSIGRIDRLDGLPFEGLELRKADKDSAWEFIAHRPHRTVCGGHADSADVLAVFDHVDGRYMDQTSRHTDYLEEVLGQNLEKWALGKERTLRLLQTIAATHARLGHREDGKRFFAMSVPSVLPDLRRRGVDPNACLEDVELLLSRLTSVAPPPSPEVASGP
jgi:hypothetical protein